MGISRAACAVVAMLVLAMSSESTRASEAWGRLSATSRDSAAAVGVSILASHGDWLWVHGDARQLIALGATTIGNDAQTFGLDLGGQPFDPVVRYPHSLASIARDSWPSLHLLQFNGPTRRVWLDDLQRAGVQPVQYIHPFTYVVWSSGSNLARAATANADIRWSGVFEASWRLGASMRGRSATAATHVMLYRPAGIDNAALHLASGVNVRERGRAADDFDIVTMTLDATAADRVLALPGVYAVQAIPLDGGLRGEVGASISAGLFNGSGVPIPGYLGWLTTLGQNGSGVIMANVDGGVHDTHPVLVNRMLPCVGSTCSLADASSHGTHVAAIMAGDASGNVQTNGFLRGLGVAPGGQLIEQSHFPTSATAGGMLTLMTQSFRNGAVLSNNSWGPTASTLGYDMDTRQVDVGTRDTDPEAAGDQPLTYVLSVTNGYGDVSSQGTPDEAKNVISVGSTNSETVPGVALPTINNVSENSAHGPALDGRLLPQLVAPGCSIDSAAFASGYELRCGTSMAAPHVAGSIALFTQYFRSRFAADPSTAVSKAAILASAQDLFGGTDADGDALTRRPNNQQGWGRLRIDRMLSNTDATWYYDQQFVFQNTGESWTRSLRAVDPTKPVVVMLAYTDAPGHGLGGSTPAWNNDLDLTVSSNSISYRGNVFGSDGYSVSGGAADARNNAEGVALRSDQLGSVLTISVGATAINSKALPNATSLLNQDFAIVCSNCTDASPPIDAIFRNGFESVDLIFSSGFDSNATP